MSAASSPSPLETASGLVFGVESGSGNERGSSHRPREALEQAVLPALQRPPCVVSFSGGLDSSAVLAVATCVARREGLAPPVPVTLRFPGIPQADEAGWQEDVVAALGVEDWQRIEIEDELSVVGPYATGVLRRHGLLWPFNAYVHAPLVEAARGGALLTGVGGDELFAGSRWDRLSRVARLRTRPGARDVRHAVLAGAPFALRERALQARCPVRLPWLRAEPQASLDRAWAAQEASEPVRAARRAPWRLGLRSLRSAVRSLAAISAADDVVAVHPLVDRAFAEALSRLHPPGTRGERLRALLGDLLPAPLYGRRSKASFNAAFWRDDARRLARDWDGGGDEGPLVDPEALREAWRADVPDGRSFLLLQALWLRREGSRAAVEPSRRAIATRAADEPPPPEETRA